VRTIRSPTASLLLQTLPIGGMEPVGRAQGASGVKRSAKPYALSSHNGSGTFGVSVGAAAISA